MKLHFEFEGSVAEIGDFGKYDAPIESALPHRFELRDGVVIDKYDGVSDEEVRVIDHAAATQAALDHVDADGNPAPLDPPPALDAISPEEA
jgi:hypothetical protein